jgi:acyl-CoA dehydrogenase
MYSFEPTDEQKMLMDAARRYATELRAAGHEAEESGAIPPKLISKGWEIGILQASIPEAFGGFGERSAVTGVLAAEELAYGDLAGALAVGTPGLFALAVLLAGTDEQRKQFLPPVIEADWKPYTAALIEPSFDFDPADLKTSAVLEVAITCSPARRHLSRLRRRRRPWLCSRNWTEQRAGSLSRKARPGYRSRRNARSSWG